MGFSLFNTVGLLTKEWGDKRFNASSYQCLNASRHLLLQGMMQKLVIDILFWIYSQKDLDIREFSAFMIRFMNFSSAIFCED